MRTIALLLAIFLPGCASLNVAWVFTASYNTHAVTGTVMNPGAKQEGVKPGDSL